MKVFDIKLFRAAREAAGLSNTELAVRLWGMGAISRPDDQLVRWWDTGRHVPSTIAQVASAEVFGVNVSDFYVEVPQQ